MRLGKGPNRKTLSSRCERCTVPVRNSTDFLRKLSTCKIFVCLICARLAQLVEHSTDTRKVLGSNPRARTLEGIAK